MSSCLPEYFHIYEQNSINILKKIVKNGSMSSEGLAKTSLTVFIIGSSTIYITQLTTIQKPTSASSTPLPLSTPTPKPTPKPNPTLTPTPTPTVTPSAPPSPSSKWMLQVDGLVQNPMIFSLEEIMTMPMSTV